MLVRVIVLCLLVISQVPTISNAATPNTPHIEVGKQLKGEGVFGRALFLEDTDSSIAHPSQLFDSDKWQPLTRASSKSGLSSNPFWIKFSLHNSSALSKTVVIASDVAFLERLDGYWNLGENTRHEYVDGLVPFNDRKILSPLPAISVDIEALSTETIYIRLANSHLEYTSLFLGLWDKKAYSAFNTKYLVKIVFFSAIALTLGGVWLIFFLVLKQTRFFIYSLLISLAGVYYLSYSGVAFQFVYPNSPEIHDRLFVFAIQLSTALSFLFFIFHLEPKKNGFHKINYIMWVLFILGSILSINALLRVVDSLAVIGAMSFSGLTILNAAFGLRVWLKTREDFAFWFMLGWSAFGVSMFAFMLFFSLGIGIQFLSNDIAHEVAQFMILLEGSTLSISLARWFQLQQFEKKKAEAASLTDPLSGLMNRRALEINLKQRQSVNLPDNEYSVVVLDIDHFKKINDKHGHITGDLVIKKASSIIKSLIRDCDTAYRIGGEEFLLLLEKCSEEDALNITERIRVKFESSPTHIGEFFVQHTLSAGITDAASLSFESTLAQADKALYQAKKEGRNKVCFSQTRALSNIS